MVSKTHSAGSSQLGRFLFFLFASIRIMPLSVWAADPVPVAAGIGDISNVHSVAGEIQDKNFEGCGLNCNYEKASETLSLQFSTLQNEKAQLKGWRDGAIDDTESTRRGIYKLVEGLCPRYPKAPAAEGSTGWDSERDILRTCTERWDTFYDPLILKIKRGLGVDETAVADLKCVERNKDGSCARQDGTAIEKYSYIYEGRSDQKANDAIEAENAKRAQMPYFASSEEVAKDMKLMQKRLEKGPSPDKLANTKQLLAEFDKLKKVQADWSNEMYSDWKPQEEYFSEYQRLPDSDSASMLAVEKRTMKNGKPTPVINTRALQSAREKYKYFKQMLDLIKAERQKNSPGRMSDNIKKTYTNGITEMSKKKRGDEDYGRFSYEQARGSLIKQSGGLMSRSVTFPGKNKSALAKPSTQNQASQADQPKLYDGTEKNKITPVGSKGKGRTKYHISYGADQITFRPPRPTVPNQAGQSGNNSSNTSSTSTSNSSGPNQSTGIMTPGLSGQSSAATGSSTSSKGANSGSTGNLNNVTDTHAVYELPY